VKQSVNRIIGGFRGGVNIPPVGQASTCLR